MKSLAKAKRACGIVCMLAIGVFTVILFCITMYGVAKEMTESALGRRLTFEDTRLIPKGETTVELPPTIIRGDLTRVIVRQEVVRSIFIRRISDSSFPLAGIEADLTLDGFLLGLEPIFAPVRKESFAQESALVFLKGEGFIEECFPAKLDECVRSLVGREYEPKRIYTEKGALARGSPRIVVIVVGPVEHSA